MQKDGFVKKYRGIGVYRRFCGMWIWGKKNLKTPVQDQEGVWGAANKGAESFLPIFVNIQFSKGNVADRVPVLHLA